MTYQPITTQTLNDGTQRKYEFKNGYGASVIQSDMSYGGAAGLWELGVLDADGHLSYDTPITEDVLGWLDEDAVQSALSQIAALPSVASA